MKEAYYFPHFCNARHDRKIKRLRKELGVEGYGIYFMLLEVLREQQDMRYPLTDIDLIADEFNTSEQKVVTVIKAYELFEIDEQEKFFSPKMLVYLEPYFRMKEQRREAGLKSGEKRKANLLPESNDRSTTVEESFNENEQSKVNESKVNESKVKESKVKESKVKESKGKEIKQEQTNNNIENTNCEFIYELYPSTCYTKGSSTGKGSKNKEKIRSLIKLNGYEWLRLRVESYLVSCKQNKVYLKNFATFLNNIPEPIEVKPQFKPYVPNFQSYEDLK